MQRILAHRAGYLTADGVALSVLEMIPVYGYDFFGGFYPVGGSGRIAKALVKAIEGRGGRVLLDAPVQHIPVEGGGCAGIELADGRRLPAAAVVSDIDFRHTFLELLAPDVVSADFRASVEQVVPSCSAFAVFLGLDIAPPLRPVTAVRHGSGRGFAIMVPSAVDPAAAPQGCASVEIVTLVPNAQARDWLAMPATEEQERRRSFADELIAAAEAVIPNLSHHIVHRSDSSPVTFARFDGSSDGAIYGIAKQSRLKSCRTPVPGLVLAGAAMGRGIEDTFISGARAAEALVPGLLCSPRRNTGDPGATDAPARGLRLGFPARGAAVPSMRKRPIADATDRRLAPRPDLPQSQRSGCARAAGRRHTEDGTVTAAQERSADERDALLGACFVFRALDAPARRELASYAYPKEHAAGAPIFRMGSPGQSMMAIVAGSVRISVTTRKGREIALADLSAGEVFGEIALIDGGERCADATALTRCTLLALDRRDVFAMLERHPASALKLLEMLCQRLRHTDERMAEIAFLDIPTRLAHALLQGDRGARLPDRPQRRQARLLAERPRQHDRRLAGEREPLPEGLAAPRPRRPEGRLADHPRPRRAAGRYPLRLSRIRPARLQARHARRGAATPPRSRPPDRAGSPPRFWCDSHHSGPGGARLVSVHRRDRGHRRNP